MKQILSTYFFSTLLSKSKKNRSNKSIITWIFILGFSISSFASSGLFDANAILNAKGAGNTFTKYSAFESIVLDNYVDNEPLILIGEPIITTQPLPATVCLGFSVSFNVQATGDGLTYQWKKGSTAISGATSSTLFLTNVTTTDVGNYSCEIIGTSGAVTSSEVALTVNTAPNISYSGVSTSYTIGTTIAALTPVNSGGTITTSATNQKSTLATGFSYPWGLAIDASGTIYVGDYGDDIVYKMSADGSVRTPIGSGFVSPAGVAVDALGNVFVADSDNNEVKKIATDNTITALGTGFAQPFGVSVDNSGSVYVADYGNNAIKKIAADNSLVTTWGDSSITLPYGVATDVSGNVYLSDAGEFVNRVKKITSDNSTTTPLGALIDGPTGIDIDALGNVFVCEFNKGINGNGAIKKIAPNATTTTLSTGFYEPYGLAVDNYGSVYVADSGNGQIIKIVPSNEYSISPALPAGLVLDTLTGIISGTPSTTSPSTTYTITIQNGCATSSTTITFAINQVPLTLTNLVYTVELIPSSTQVKVTATADLQGVLPADAANVTLTPGIATIEATDLGTGVAIVFSGFVLEGSAAGNYFLNIPLFNTSTLKMPVPLATAATEITSTSFKANWQEVPGASVYRLDVSTDSGFGTGTFVSGYENLAVGNVLSYHVTGLSSNTTYYYRARVEHGSAVSDNSNVITVGTITSCTWNGSVWSNTTGPTASIEAFIEGVYATTANGGFTANRLTINSGSLTVNSGTTITVVNNLVNNLSADKVVIENNANLIQTNNLANTGVLTVNRNSSSLYRLDYTMWSSPVTGSQTMMDFSPLTLTDRFYEYLTSTNLYSVVLNSTPFSLAKGYLIRMPNTWADAPTGPTASFQGSFIGTPNNGDITFTMSNAGTGYNAVGNPYPSTIKMSSFLSANTANIEGAIYFWRKTNDKNNATSYSTCTTGGCTLENSHVYPELDYISSGQGFIVQAKAGKTTLNFNNAMRIENNTNQFFKTKLVERNRVWINLLEGSSQVNQMLVVYMDDAVAGVDAIDGKYINDNPTALTSDIAGEEYVIQGRPTFSDTDVVNLNFKASAAGTYTIAKDHVDGLFATGQDIYLVDNVTGTETNLQKEAYTFTAAAGANNTRFQLTYKTSGSLKVNDLAFDENSISVYKQNGVLNINAGNTTMKSVKVFDVTGRLLLEQKAVNATTTALKNLAAGKQAMLIQITSDDNRVVTKKAIN